MAIKVVMPHVAETVVEGTIVRWLKKEGDILQEAEPLVEIMTDKVTLEMPSPASGVLKHIVAKEGTIVTVGGDLAVIEESAAAPERATPAAEPVAAAPPAQPRAYHSPIVMAIAREHGVDLAQVKGTGVGGRVTKQDVLAYVAQRQKVPAAPTAAPAPAPTSTAALAEEAIPVSPLRRTIAERMAKSAQSIPHAWAVFEADLTELVKWRERMKEEFRARQGVNLTYLPFIIRAVVEALKTHPTVNATWAGDRIVLKKRFNIAIAVATDQGLVTPVIQDADKQSITGLAKELHRLIEKAHAGKLSLPEVQGATFTVNNAGAFGTFISMPIINPPQAAILTVDAIRKRAVVLESDAIAVRSMMNMTLAFDHRVFDGATAGLFLQKVKSLLEGFTPASTPLY